MDGFRLPTMGVLLASGLAAGVLAYTISRRSSREETLPVTALEKMRGLGDLEATRAGREYLAHRVVPEMKPVLLDLLKDVERYVNDYFRKVEKAVKAM